MAKYGYCPDCGSTMEAVGCSNCDELAVIQQQSYWDNTADETETCSQCGAGGGPFQGGACPNCWQRKEEELNR